MGNQIVAAGRYVKQGAVQHPRVWHGIVLQEYILQLVELIHNGLML